MHKIRSKANVSNFRAIFRLGHITPNGFPLSFTAFVSHKHRAMKSITIISGFALATSNFELQITFIGSNPQGKCKCCFCIFQGDTGIPGVQGSKGEKVVVDSNAFSFLLPHFHYHMVLVSHNGTLFPQGANGVKGPKGRVRPSQRLLTFLFN